LIKFYLGLGFLICIACVDLIEELTPKVVDFPNYITYIFIGYFYPGLITKLILLFPFSIFKFCNLKSRVT